MQAGSPQLLVSVATYNERDNISRLIDEIHQFAPQADILVVDDNSPDGTGRVVDEMAAKDSRIKAYHRPGKLGLGTAIVAAMRYAMANQYGLLVNMDADFSHPARYLPALVEGMNRHDVMIGSRYVPGGGTQNWPWAREAISRGVNGLVRFFFRMGVRDASGAFRCYRVSKLREVRLDLLVSRGYSFQQEVLYRCRLAGCQLGETPIIFENRRAGKSKVNLKEAVRSMLTIIYLGVRAMVGIEKQRSKRRPTSRS
ncbi:MAG TPA: polyprenol monophosphomannose synthase [Gemmataceae bacterium]|jgi:dolichol-phosphate mannosyltransferase|nr:polyprenol monophosphomannose synthase [Gemmataceae bacterium]